LFVSTPNPQPTTNNKKQQRTENTMLILVTGSTGMLGREFVEQGKKRGHEMIGWTRAELDLEKPQEGIRKIAELKPDAVIHCAAETNVDLCEREPQRARQVNGQAPGELAAAAKKAGARFVLISTSGIFGGTCRGPHREEDVPEPETAYAKAKMVGERAVTQSHPGALILRAGWLFGGSLDFKKNFVGSRLREAQMSEEMISAEDKFGSPTWTKDFAGAALKLLEEGQSGVVHLANSGQASRFEYVSEILKISGRPNKIRAVDSGHFPRAAPVPVDERLASTRIPPLRDWREALRGYLQSQL
jgi:dTDP-4-dehydrorhamnose reductase